MSEREKRPVEGGPKKHKSERKNRESERVCVCVRERESERERERVFEKVCARVLESGKT